MESYQFEPYNGPKARVAVVRFEDKTGLGQQPWWNPDEIGDGMADMLTTALMASNRYIVLDRDVQDAIANERGIAGATGQIEAAELLFVGAVTEFKPNSGGIGAGRVSRGLAIFGGLKKSHVAIDVRVVEVRTSRVLAATSVKGEARDLGALLGDVFGSTLGVLGAFSNTPMEQAVRVAIIKAVDDIIRKTPAEFFHYEEPRQSDRLDSSNASDAGSEVFVATASLNMRSAPSTNSMVVGSLTHGSRVTVRERRQGWLRIVTSDGREGWVSARYTSAQRP